MKAVNTRTVEFKNNVIANMHAVSEKYGKEGINYWINGGKLVDKYTGELVVKAINYDKDCYEMVKVLKALENEDNYCLVMGPACYNTNYYTVFRKKVE